ncbi:phage holin family protein [Ruminococcus sp. NK3A76]|uniref:phage holin family protein n=1 Tax=Ruminococcus sp. NK3A76 TaxID=877411 RepID=UPI000490E232|nr:phage holin family protein [Ruminococcus sp. NK3A76]
MDKHNTIKALCSAVVAGLTAYFKVIAVPVALLVVVMLIDYASGVANAFTKGEWSSKVGLRGIVKKVGYMGVVIVAAVFDWLIYSGLKGVGVSFDGSYYFGLIVTIWLIINECISILENLGELGVPLPTFLIKGIKKLQKNIEDKGGNDNE